MRALQKPSDIFEQCNPGRNAAHTTEGSSCAHQLYLRPRDAGLATRINREDSINGIACGALDAGNKSWWRGLTGGTRMNHGTAEIANQEAMPASLRKISATVL